MFKKILASMGMGMGNPSSTAANSATDGPYRHETANFIYQILFCDQPELFQKQGPASDAPWSLLFAGDTAAAALRTLACDPAMDSRVRVLAWNRLRKEGEDVPAKIHLGTIVEVGLPGGLDTLAAFTDGGVRYINHTGKMSIVEGDSSIFKEEVAALLAASQPVVNAIGPWDQPRRPAPGNGMVRLTFLVSDGLYFGEGPMQQFQSDSMAGPVIAAAGTLLVKLVDQVKRKPA